MAVKGVIINPVLGAVVLSKGIVGLAGINPVSYTHLHQHCRRRQVEMRLRQKEDRDADRRSDGKTNELPLGQVEHDLRFDAVITKAVMSVVEDKSRPP